MQIKLVCKARPDDRAAKETESFFHQILVEDHGVTELEVVPVGEDLLQIRYVKDEQPHQKTFDREWSEQLLRDINANPKFNE